MKNISKYLQRRERELESGIRVACRDRQHFPEGRLRDGSNKRQKRYYLVKEDSGALGEYISMKERVLIEGLAQKAYNFKFLKAGQVELARIRRVKRSLELLEQEGADQAYLSLPSYRKKLIRPYVKTDEDYVAEWQATTWEGLENKYPGLEFETRRGELVRSKSEAIIADILDEFGIPYHYEKPLRLENGLLKYPDFTLLKVDDRREIYLEHFGMLDNVEYMQGACKKLYEYQRNGVYLGYNLLVTFEAKDMPLSTRTVRDILKGFFNL